MQGDQGLEVTITGENTSFVQGVTVVGFEQSGITVTDTIVDSSTQVRAVIDMLRYDVHGVLLTFAFVALIPFPLILIMGIMILIIWHYHKRDIVAGKRQTR